jgi:HD-like signal output (HDOD) protein
MSTLPASPGTPEKTLDLLWTRVRQRGDLPGFSKVINAILAAMRGEDDREFNMTKTVLSDPALTQKVLRLANSAMYAVFGQEINTVSKAVVVLGTESIGHLALGTKLVDGLSSASAESDSARDEMEKAVLSGHIARQVASGPSVRDAEEAVVCSMLHSLGRMMVSFYLSDRWAMVQAYSDKNGVSEADGARYVFGMGLDEIGRAIARQWGFPAQIVGTLRDIEPNAVNEPLDHIDWLAAVSTMSARCAEVIHEDQAAGEETIAALANNYADMLGMDASHLLAAVKEARTTAEQDAVFTRPPKTVETPSETVAEVRQKGKPADAAQILRRGVDDMREMVNDVSVGQLMTMGLETVFKGLGLRHAIAFLHNTDEKNYAARLCLGEGMQGLMPRLIFDDAYQPDVFHASLANDKMIFVENAHAPAFMNKLPRWWKDALPSVRSFMVLPLTVNRRAIGFIYGDWDEDQTVARMESAEILPMDELRALIVKTVEKRRRQDANLKL